jgi:hypothetical protein
MELLIVAALVVALSVACMLWAVDSTNLPHSGLS